MNCNVGTLDKHLYLKLFCKQAFISRLCQGHAQNLIALNGHRLDRDLQVWAASLQ